MNSRPIRRLAALIQGIESAMFTTINSDGTIHSRPMVVQDFEFDGDLWFYTYKRSGKIEDIQEDNHVSIAFMDAKSNRYISVSGSAEVHTDAWTLKKMWSDTFSRWFPEGPRHPDLALIKVSVSSAQIWDAPHSELIEELHFKRSTYKTYSERVCPYPPH